MESLYNIASIYGEALHNIEIDENGEVHGAEELEAIDGDFTEKVESIALFIKDNRAMANSIKEEEQALAMRRRGYENKANYFENYVSDSMQAVGKDKVETAKCRVTFRKSESVQVSNLDLFPVIYKKAKTTEAPDKTAIKNAIKEGIEIQGAELILNQNIQIK